MIAGDEALGWVLENPDVAVFWKDQYPPGTTLQIPRDLGRLAFEYHIAPRTDNTGPIQIERAQLLLEQIIDIEEPTFAPSQPTFRHKRIDLFENRNVYQPGRASYRACVATQTSKEECNTVLTTGDLSQSLLSPIILTQSRATKEEKHTIHLSRNFHIHPEPSLARFSVLKQWISTELDHRHPVNSKTALKDARRLVDPEYVEHDMMLAYSTGKEEGKNPEDETPNIDPALKISDIWDCS